MSNDEFVEVSNQSWFDRIKSAIGGIVFGFILFTLSFQVLAWNEGRALEHEIAIKDLSNSYVNAQCNNVSAINNGKAVYLSCKSSTDEILTDNTFNISLNAIGLMRDVEMYQWKEVSESDTRKKLGGGTETVTRYSYEKEWSSSINNSSSFKKSGHTNPSTMPYSYNDIRASNVKLGDYQLSDSLINKINKYKQVQLDSDVDAQNGQIIDNMIYIGNDISFPKIGDVKITFSYVPAVQPITVMATQIGNTFEPFISKNDISIERLKVGQVSPKNMIKSANDANNLQTWLYRLAGFLMMFIGLNMVFGILPVLADFIPILGDIVELGLGLIIGIVSFILTIITVAIFWLAVRPILAVSLILIVLAIAYYVLNLKRNKVISIKQSNC